MQRGHSLLCTGASLSSALHQLVDATLPNARRPASQQTPSPSHNEPPLWHKSCTTRLLKGDVSLMAALADVKTRTDSAIREDVVFELKWEPKISSSDIAVAVKDGVVTLSGFASSYME